MDVNENLKMILLGMILVLLATLIMTELVTTTPEALVYIMGLFIMWIGVGRIYRILYEYTFEYSKIRKNV